MKELSYFNEIDIVYVPFWQMAMCNRLYKQPPLAGFG